MKNLIIACLLGSMLACETQEGTVDLTYIEQGEQELELGKILLMWVTYEVDGKNLVNTRPDRPMAMMYDTSSVATTGMIKGVIDRLKVGDSVHFELPAQNLWEVSFQRPLPDSITTEAMVDIKMRILDQVTQQGYQAYMMEIDEKRNAKYYDEEAEALDAYIAENDVDATVSSSGLRYVIHEQGSGPEAEAGDQVNVKYKGTTLDGAEFDSGEYEFVLGRGGVIGGWDEGIAYLKQGAKATLYIPSKLGYGSRGSGQAIPPFASLIFEVELLEVSKQ